jgi:hypothetical protein
MQKSRVTGFPGMEGDCRLCDVLASVLTDRLYYSTKQWNNGCTFSAFLVIYPLQMQGNQGWNNDAKSLHQDLDHVQGQLFGQLLSQHQLEQESREEKR